VEFELVHRLGGEPLKLIAGLGVERPWIVVGAERARNAAVRSPDVRAGIKANGGVLEAVAVVEPRVGR